MKRAGCLFASFLILLPLGLGALHGLQRIRAALLEPEADRRPGPAPSPAPGPAPGPAPVVPPPPPDPDRYRPWVDSLNEFRRDDAGASYRLTFGFIDHGGVTHRVTCSISKSDYEAEAASFGYVESEMDREIDRRLQPILDREIERRGVRDYVTVESRDGGGFRWRSHYPPGADQAAVARVEAMTAYLESEYRQVVDQVRADLFRERGLRLADNELTVDYGGVVVRGQRPLSNCYLALRAEALRYSERQSLGLYLAFFQEIRYEVPPDEVRGKKTLGFWVPTEVLVNAHGDCDSKAVAFSAMMRSMGKPLLVIAVPRHVLVGVETRPGPGQAYVRVGNRYFVLCEVAGPGKLAPGEEGSKPRVSGFFEYTLIEPDAAGFSYGSSPAGASRAR